MKIIFLPETGNDEETRVNRFVLFLQLQIGTSANKQHKKEKSY